MIVGRDRTALPRSFFDRPVLEVAESLLGHTLLRATERGLIAVRLTEVEAYAGEQDPGSHAYRGRTQRNSSMFGPPGHAYVYFTYGMWHCLNLVCGPEGTASGVLLRGGEVTMGAELARTNRPKARRDTELAKGPARLATALEVDRQLNGVDVCPTSALPQQEEQQVGGNEAMPPLSLLQGERDASLIRTGPRTGVGGDGAHQPWRFWLDDEPSVSQYRPHQARKRRAGGR